MRLAFTEAAWGQYQEWAADRRARSRVDRLIEATLRSPYDGIGRPEALRGNLQGYWSRRIDREHRLVYKVEDEPADDGTLVIIQCRHHY